MMPTSQEITNNPVIEQTETETYEAKSYSGYQTPSKIYQLKKDFLTVEKEIELKTAGYEFKEIQGMTAELSENEEKLARLQEQIWEENIEEKHIIIAFVNTEDVTHVYLCENVNNLQYVYLKHKDQENTESKWRLTEKSNAFEGYLKRNDVNFQNKLGNIDFGRSSQRFTRGQEFDPRGTNSQFTYSPQKHETDKKSGKAKGTPQQPKQETPKETKDDASLDFDNSLIILEDETGTNSVTNEAFEAFKEDKSREEQEKLIEINLLPLPQGSPLDTQIPQSEGQPSKIVNPGTSSHTLHGQPLGQPAARTTAQQPSELTRLLNQNSNVDSTVNTSCCSCNIF